VLGVIAYLYVADSIIAIESLRAMFLRTFVWFVAFLGFSWMRQQDRKSV
jgi:hypothetical protein